MSEMKNKVIIEEVIGEQEGPKTVEEIELPVEGSESECIVLLIKVGKLYQLIDIEKIRNEKIRESYEQKRNRLAIKIVCKEKTTSEVFEDTIMFSFHSKARYPKIAARYGKIRVGDTLRCRIEGGRWKIV